MKHWPTRVVPHVQAQIAAQVIYIAQDSIDNAVAWELRLRRAIDSIGDLPGHAIDEDASDRLGYPIRKFVFEKAYLIHYYVDDAVGVVKIVNFRHGARLPAVNEP